MKHRRWRTEGLADLHIDDPKQTDINWTADLHLVIRHQNTLRTFRWAVQPSVWLHCLHFPREVFVAGPNFMMKKWSFSCSSSASVKYERSFQGGRFHWLHKGAWLYLSLWENKPPSHLIHYLSKQIPCEFMVSICSFKSSSTQHDVHSENNGPILCKIETNDI